MDCLYKQKNIGPNNQYIVDKTDHQNQDIRLNGKRRQCDPEFDSYCQRNYQNGYCDQGCNNEQCGWDGLDCLEINQKNNVKQFNYAELPYVARGSLFITLDLPVSKISINGLNASIISKSQKSDERPIFAILRALSQIVGTTLRVKQNYNDGSFSLKPILGDNGENMTEVEVIADNRMCEYDCFDSTTQIANYLAAFQARTNEISHQFGQSSKFALKSIRATEEAESLVASKYPKAKGDEPTTVTTWISTCLIVIFIGLMLGVLIANKEKKIARGITWFPDGFQFKLNSEGSCRSISTYQAAGGDYLRKPLGKLRGNLNKMDRKPDGQEMSKAWLHHHETIHENKELTAANAHSHVIYEEPKDPRSWSMQHYEAYGDGTKNGSNCANSNNILMPLPMPSNLKELLHPGLRQTQNMMMQTKADTEAMTNGLLSPPLVNSLSGGVDVVGPSGLTPLMIAAAFRGATPYCGVGDECTQNESTKLLENNNNNCIELMDTHNGPGSAGSSTSTNGNGPNSSSSMIDELIAQGASVDKKMENTGETSLHLAARFCRADAVKRLLEAKADCNAQDFSGRTPLHTAIAADALGAFEILIRNRATSLNAKSNDGNTPLILAIRNCSDQMMLELINAGADINATDNGQRTALHWAAMVSNLKGLKALIEHGANKDAQDEKEQTPLFLAAREGAYECVKVLLEFGANKDITDHMDVSPKKVAETKFHKDIIQLLDGNVQINLTNTNTNVQNENNPNSPAVANSPKKPLNSSNNDTGTNTAKRAKKQPTKSSNQTQTKFVPQQQQRSANASDLLQQANMQQTAAIQQSNYNNTNSNQVNTNSGTLKKGQQIVQQIQQVNPNSVLNQQPPPLPPPRPQLQPVPINSSNNKMPKNQIVNLPPIQNPANYNQQSLPSPFDYMMHTPLTPTTCNLPNGSLLMNQPVQQLTMPNTPNSIPAINSPSNHVLLSPNNTVLMSPPHHSSMPAHYLGKPPPYESINHCTQQISNATYMAATQMHPNQWAKPLEPNYYTIYNITNNNNQNNDSSYLTPSPDSPSNWSATTSPASNGDWLELQTPQQQQAQAQQIAAQQQIEHNNNQQIVNNNNQTAVSMIDPQQQLMEQQQLSPEQFNQINQATNQVTQMQTMTATVNEQQQQNPPAYQSSCNQQQPQQTVVNNTRQITSTQQAVFL